MQTILVIPPKWLQLEGGARDGRGLPPAIQRLLDAKDNEIAALRAQVYALQCIVGGKSDDRHAREICKFDIFTLHLHQEFRLLVYV